MATMKPEQQFAWSEWNALEQAVEEYRMADSVTARNKLGTVVTNRLNTLLWAQRHSRPLARRPRKDSRSSSEIIADLKAKGWVEITYETPVRDRLLGLNSRRALYEQLRWHNGGRIREAWAPLYLVQAIKAGHSDDELKKIMRSSSQRDALSFAAHAQS